MKRSRAAGNRVVPWDWPPTGSDSVPKDEALSLSRQGRKALVTTERHFRSINR
jgi:hypothetical protein